MFENLLSMGGLGSALLIITIFMAVFVFAKGALVKVGTAVCLIMFFLLSYSIFYMGQGSPRYLNEWLGGLDEEFRVEAMWEDWQGCHFVFRKSGDISRYYIHKRRCPADFSLGDPVTFYDEEIEGQYMKKAKEELK